LIYKEGKMAPSEDETTARVVNQNYKPSSSDIDITDLLKQENPEFFDNMLKMLTGTPKGFRNSSKGLTSQEKRVKKERRKRARKSRKLNR
jgi:hypothetical protein